MATADAPTAPSALPYVSWSSLTVAEVPLPDWPSVFGSMQALKGHIQEYPGCQKLEAFVTATDDIVRIYCFTTWDTPEQLEAFLERGYTFERMLADVTGIPAQPVVLLEKVF
jgi:hypothetical protein